MKFQSICLTLGGSASLLIAALHLALAACPRLYRFFGGEELARLHEQGSPFTVLVSLGLAVLFAAWGLYALSGAGLVRPLPLLKAVLITAGVIYVLRSLMLPSEIYKVVQNGHPIRFLVFSTGSLGIGLLHLCGMFVR